MQRLENWHHTREDGHYARGEDTLTGGDWHYNGASVSLHVCEFIYKYTVKNFEAKVKCKLKLTCESLIASSCFFICPLTHITRIRSHIDTTELKFWLHNSCSQKWLWLQTFLCWVNYSNLKIKVGNKKSSFEMILYLRCLPRYKYNSFCNDFAYSFLWHVLGR